jgi:hypothetical protein
MVWELHSAEGGRVCGLVMLRWEDGPFATLLVTDSGDWQAWDAGVLWQVWRLGLPPRSASSWSCALVRVGSRSCAEKHAVRSCQQ